ncbi:MAG: acyltransferase [Bacteroidia bacterium]|nr:acyltransferase [Bacteroidia bacterium]MCZ2276874.1 acyltransferase [Bacteroidia bacterium]
MRLPELDFIRGIAIILVIFFHFPVEPFLSKIGYTGVDLFFVLSGFLISGLLFSERDKYGDVKPLRFLIRRGLKIYPLFYFFMVVSLCSFWFYGEHFSILHLIGELTFTRNYLGGIWVHTWSLCVEEHFYFTIALIMLFSENKFWNNKHKVNGVFIALFVFSTMLELFNVLLENIYGTNYFFNVWARRVQTQYVFDSLLYGVFISYHYRYNRANLQQFLHKYRFVLFIVSLMIALIAPLGRTPFFNPIKDVLLYVSYGNIMLLMVTGEISIRKLQFSTYSKWFFNMICTIGVYSYSIYLFHVFVRDKIIEKHELLYTSSYAFLIYFVTSVAFGILSARLVEIPSLKLRDRYFPSRSQKNIFLQSQKAGSGLDNSDSPGHTVFH